MIGSKNAFDVTTNEKSVRVANSVATLILLNRATLGRSPCASVFTADARGKGQVFYFGEIYGKEVRAIIYAVLASVKFGITMRAAAFRRTERRSNKRRQ